MIGKIIRITNTLLDRVMEARKDGEKTITISIDEAIKILALTAELKPAAHDYDLHHSNKNKEYDYWG